jgi:antitoxin component YwqK of YwqJK toxin-antitoxin module
MKQKLNQHDAKGRRHGVWEDYWSDGTLGWRRHYLHGKRHGLWEDYRSDGTLYRRGHYHHGKEHGVWEEYHSNDTLSLRVFYNMGSRVGLEEKWDEKGNLTYSKNHGGQVLQEPEFSSPSSGPISKSLDFVMPDPSDMFAPITRDF